MLPPILDDLHLDIDAQFPDNSTELITPAIVRGFLHELLDTAIRALAEQATKIPRSTIKMADYTLANTDFGSIVTFSSGSDLNLVLPLNSVAMLDLDGAVQILNLGTGNVFVTFASGVTVISESGGYKVPPKAEAGLYHLDLDTWFMGGGRS